MTKACQALFENLHRCLSDSACVQNHPDKTKALRDCAAADAKGVEESCKAIRVAYSQCRKAQIDPRRRIRGPPKNT